MKRFWSCLPALLLISHGCNCGLEEEFDYVCPQPIECYLALGEDNIEKNIIIGEELELYEDDVCSFGQTVCDKETQQITCENVEYPEKEICDGIDNDCNGEIDDGSHLNLSRFDSDNPCFESQKGVCRLSEAHCEVGHWVCRPPEDLYGSEVCDGRDNDCDGVVDEDIEDIFTYDGPPETLNVGECRAGVSTCVDGQIISHGMVTPVLEICGNGDDDDCDGLIDEREDGHDEYDFALVIDVSGSMSTFIYSIRQALCDWQSDPRFQNSKFAILAVATDDIPYGARVVSDFVDAADACHVLDNFFNTPLPTMAEEFQLDLILKSMTIGDDIDISWSSNRKKKIVVFSDEAPQFLMPPNPNPNGLFPTVESKIDEIIEACVATETDISVFSVYFAPWNPYWQDMVNNCAGYLEFLSFDHDLMVDRLNYWFGDEC